MKQQIKNTLNQAKEHVKSPWAFIPWILVLVLGIFFLPGILKKQYNKWKANKERKAIENGSIVVPTGVIQVQTSPSKTKTINLVLIARSIYDAIYNNDWGGFTEDETEMINLIKQVPASYIGRLSEEYGKISSKGRTLQEEYIKYISKSDLTKSGVWNLINQ